MSLCRFFEPNFDSMQVQYQIEGSGLREVDLYGLIQLIEKIDYSNFEGNYFSTLPILPQTIQRIRLSVTGEEDVQELIRRLCLQPQLTEINLQLECLDDEVVSFSAPFSIRSFVLLGDHLVIVVRISRACRLLDNCLNISVKNHSLFQVTLHKLNLGKYSTLRKRGRRKIFFRHSLKRPTRFSANFFQI